jgi:hypothetical protein
VVVMPVGCWRLGEPESKQSPILLATRMNPAACTSDLLAS